MALLGGEEGKATMEYFLEEVIRCVDPGEESYICCVILDALHCLEDFKAFLQTEKEEFESVCDVFRTGLKERAFLAMEKLICCQWYAFFILHLYDLDFETLPLEEWKEVATVNDFMEFMIIYIYRG